MGWQQPAAIGPSGFLARSGACQAPELRQAGDRRQVARSALAAAGARQRWLDGGTIPFIRRYVTRLP
jgi:hypothetical protein